MLETVIGIVGLAYLSAGFALGLREVYQMHRAAALFGHNAVSNKVFDIPYGEEGGTTPISFHVFPVALYMMIWPLILWGDPGENP